MRLKGVLSLVILTGLIHLYGCAPAVMAGAAAAVAVTHDRRSVGTFIDDAAVEFTVKTRIAEDQDLSRQVHINVISINGVVLLTGEAPTMALRDQVLAKVKGIENVRRINNEIQISPVAPLTHRTNDAWLTGKVKAKMISAKNLDSTRVKVVTERSVVYLMGMVKRDEAQRATEVARAIGGVARVVKLFEYID